jgi:NADH dehydrogenase
VAILVTGAAGLVGRAAVAALLRQGVEHVRAVVREPAQVGDLRRLGAKVALLDATDPDGLAAAMDGVFTACSLTGGLWPRPGEDPSTSVVEPARVFLTAATTAGVRRVVVCSPAAVGHATAGNPHLTAKAEVERLVATSGLEHAILRCTHVLGPGARLPALLAGRPPVLVPGDGRQRVAPVWVGDVADAIAAADDTAELGAVTWSVAGPTQLTFDDLVNAIHGAQVAKRHPGRGDGRWLTETQAGVLAADSLGDPALPAPPGLVPTPLAEALARSMGLERSRVAGTS